MKKSTIFYIALLAVSLWYWVGSPSDDNKRYFTSSDGTKFEITFSNEQSLKDYEVLAPKAEEYLKQFETEKAYFYEQMRLFSQGKLRYTIADVSKRFNAFQDKGDIFNGPFNPLFGCSKPGSTLALAWQDVISHHLKSAKENLKELPQQIADCKERIATKSHLSIHLDAPKGYKKMPAPYCTMDKYNLVIDDEKNVKWVDVPPGTKWICTPGEEAEE